MPHLKKNDSLTDPNICPLYSDRLASLSSLTLIENEFDYIRICNDVFCQLVK
ncbi:hypothetical protein SAMN02982927_02787 [Sporolactobacillus nakayamae]|uniref:Uncharacterized protein n=1 Tax=Sporolactobacillus nakayamae TaxID=269670 RepID=A0A1I2UQJ5_9BACL|nr:hypothetical protein SAMN02982927_02787 [Sporolactobacillus nakayamae]